jgi:AcrR family transcriptional regulator
MLCNVIIVEPIRGRLVSQNTHPSDPVIHAALAAVLDKRARRSDAQARVEKLKAAALMECAEKGYGAVSVAQIATRAKVSTASVYATYKDRDALLVSAMEMLFGILADDVIEVPPLADPMAQVERLLLAHGEVYQQPLTIWLFRLYMTITCKGHAHLRALGQQAFAGIDAFWRGFLGKMVADGHLVELDLDLIVPLLLGAVERATIVANLASGEPQVGPLSLASVARHATQLLFTRWGSKTWWQTDRATQPAHVPWDRAVFQNEVERILADPRREVLDWSAMLARELKAYDADHSIKTATKRMLLATAVVCQARFYDASGIKEIAAAARVSTASVYKNFADKATLFTEALAEAYTAIEPLSLRATTENDKKIDTAQAIYQIATRAAGQDREWMHHIVMASDLATTVPIVAMARRERLDEEAFLAAAYDMPASADEAALTLNFLLGGVTREGILSLMLFGITAVNPKQLAQLSVAADWHLRPSA